mgnify:CR=1 FL=1
MLERFADVEDVAAKVWIYVELVRDLRAGVEHGGVIPAPDEATDSGHLHVGLLAEEVHSDLASHGRVLVAPAAHDGIAVGGEVGAD